MAIPSTYQQLLKLIVSKMDPENPPQNPPGNPLPQNPHVINIMPLSQLIVHAIVLGLTFSSSELLTYYLLMESIIHLIIMYPCTEAKKMKLTKVIAFIFLGAYALGIAGLLKSTSTCPPVLFYYSFFTISVSAWFLIRTIRNLVSFILFMLVLIPIECCIETAETIRLRMTTRQNLRRALAKMAIQIQGASANVEICSICTDPMIEGDEIRALPNCIHKYHQPCVDRWLEQGHFTCPNCRSNILAPAPEETACTV